MTDRLACLSSVTLVASAEGMNKTFPAGTHGCIVDVYDDGYAVEIFDPVSDVVFVDLDAVTSRVEDKTKAV